MVGLSFQSPRMAELFTWIVFRAHPTELIQKEDFHPDFLGTFVCPVLRTRPDELLEEVLRNQKLSLIEIVDQKKKSREDDWGMHERLKAQADEQGYGLALIKMHARPIEVD